ncbi:caspase, EACC1-associated type [Acaryochloris marina NIES-2412]|uniref:caspase, EACC1-associated type n=1 Tax=Acaryochloris marina TaxID=155978 RepID=UPI004058B25C
MAKLALLIGVSEYQPGLEPLPAAVNDIKAMQRVLLNSEMGGFSEAKLLENPGKTEIETEIENLFSDCTKDDLVLLFFSGHGIKDDSARLYFAARNTVKNKKGELIRASAVPARFVHDRMKESRCRRLAVILDCCFSGAFDPALTSKDDGSVDLKGQLGSQGRVVLTSSSSTQYSFQHENSNLSIYTRYLVEGIESGAGDADEDGLVSADELHKYAADKVRETAPNMTPKIIVMKEEGYNLVLAKARLKDPKLIYRKEVAKRVTGGHIRPSGRSFLNEKREQLRLTDSEANEIEAEVLRPFQKRLENLEKYREALIDELEHEYPLSAEANVEMVNLQNLWGLRDEDVVPIQKEVEEAYSKQGLTYQKYLAQYEQALVDAIDQQFPFSQETSQALLKLQESLGLRVEDINPVRQPLIEQAAVKHQQKLRQEAQEQQQKEKQDEFENNLRRYQKEFKKAVGSAYPLDDYVRDGLKKFQQSLGLADAEVAQLEQPALKRAEAKRQEQIRQEVEVQRQAEAHRQEELRKKEAEKRRQAQSTQPVASSPTPQSPPKPSSRTKPFSWSDSTTRRAFLGLLGLAGAGTIGLLASNDSSEDPVSNPNEIVTVDAQGKIIDRQPLPQLQSLSEDLGNGLGLEMVLIPGKTFTMGSPSNEPERNDDEGPQYKVTVPSFYLGKYQVTQAQWEAIMGTNPSNFKGANRPVEQVSWNDAVGFCQKLSEKIGKDYRLPSEAEWEYACRAGTTTPFYFGQTITPKIANYDGTSTYGNGPKGDYRKQTTDVGSFPPNAFGLYDMHGNVLEWCQDHWHENYSGAPTNGSAWIEGGDNSRRVFRGGFWFSSPGFCRSAYRRRGYPGARDDIVGFRVALVAPSTLS